MWTVALRPTCSKYITAEFGFGTTGLASAQPLLGIWSSKKVVKSVTLMEVEISTPFAADRSELC